MPQPVTTKFGNTEFKWGSRTYIMGIINLSPESFGGDGLNDTKAAIEQGIRFANEGADILDIGGESTKPGYQPITIEEELARVMPVIEGLKNKISIPLSIDTMKPQVARQALAAGVDILNDQWGLKKEPGLAKMAAEYGVPIILMSNQRDRGNYDAGIQRDTAHYDDVMKEIKDSLRLGVNRALEAGLPRENIIIDPGIGFGKTWKQDLEIIRRLRELKEFGQPLLVGPSRKSFIRMVLELPPDQRVEGTAAAVAISIFNGADMVRVHDVKAMSRLCRMADAISRGIEYCHS